MRVFGLEASFGIIALVAAVVVAASPVSTFAGCGCEKPPPPTSQILPNVAPAGTAIRLLHASFAAGQRHRVRFTSATGGTFADVPGTVVVRRDLADGKSKPQLVVPLPALPIGPASVAIYDATSGRLVTSINDAQLTVAPTPIALPTTYGTGKYPGYQAAVGRDGTVYIALDLTGIEMPMVFDAQARKYPLRFQGDDVAFYNAQGFLMQLLTQGAEPVPGMFVFPAGATSTDSDVLHYSRHEFVTYFLQHHERAAHDVDPSDGNWHQDGTPHIDHNGMILAIYGLVNGAPPKAGATPAFELAITTHSLFSEGLVGTSSVAVNAGATVDSYAPLLGRDGVVTNTLLSTSLLGKNGLTNAGGALSTGDVFSAGALTVANRTTIEGDVTGKTLTIASGARITGDRYKLVSSPTFMSFKTPTGIKSLGAVDFGLGVRTISGPGSFAVSRINLTGVALLIIDNTRGPVTLYVNGPVNVGNLASVLVLNRNPEQFAIYVTTSAKVTLTGKLLSSFHGVVYAPNSSVTIGRGAQFYGAFVGKTVSNSGAVHYYSPLRSPSAAMQRTS